MKVDVRISEPRCVVRDALAGIRLGQGLSSRNLEIIPLYSHNGAPPPCVTLKEALDAGTFVVTEVSEGGSVGTLKAENHGDRPVLILAGDELVGAKQNRVANVTVLVAVHSDLVIPVSCVERGRWAYRSRRFAPGRTAFASLRRSMTNTVRDSARRAGVFTSDQRRVWGDIQSFQRFFAVLSQTAAMADGYHKLEGDLKPFKEHFAYPAGATGLAVFSNGSLAGLELFGHPETLGKVWDSQVESYAVDALWQSEVERPLVPPEHQATGWLERIGNSLEQPRKSVGLGHDVGVESAEFVGAALVNDDNLVHLMAFGNGCDKNGKGDTRSQKEHSR